MTLESNEQRNSRQLESTFHTDCSVQKSYMQKQKQLG